ncbi:MAG: hypothetical protein AAFV88_17820 [Planctomycetota bacterium]
MIETSFYETKESDVHRPGIDVAIFKKVKLAGVENEGHTASKVAAGSVGLDTSVHKLAGGPSKASIEIDNG